jgi:hypothetical protein
MPSLFIVWSKYEIWTNSSKYSKYGDEYAWVPHQSKYFEGLLKDMQWFYIHHGLLCLALSESQQPHVRHRWHWYIQSDDPEPKLTAYGHSKHKGCCNWNLCRLVQSVDSDCEDPKQPGPKVTCNECKNKVNSTILIHQSTMLTHLNCRVMAAVPSEYLCTDSYQCWPKEL